MMEAMTMPAGGVAMAGLERGEAQFERSRLTLQGAQDKDSLRRAAEEFEGLVLGQMLAPIVNTVPTDGVMGGGHAETVYRSFLVDEIGKAVSRAGGVGIADMVYEQFISMQER